MKVEANEYDGCFSFHFTAETMQEAALLTRFGVNSTKDIRVKSVYVDNPGTFTGSLVLGKHRRACAQIVGRK